MTRSVRLLVSSGNGPGECQQAVAYVLRHMRKEAALVGLDLDISETPGRDGPRSAVVIGYGAVADQLAARWEGTVQWIAKSRLRRGYKRQNWFVGVFRLPATGGAGPRPDIPDIRFEAFRAGGPGGQHQNTTDSAVRATCARTGLSVVVRDGRSQHRNKALAVERLAALQQAQDETDRADQRRDQNLLHHQLQRGNPVRCFKGGNFEEMRK